MANNNNIELNLEQDVPSKEIVDEYLAKFRHEYNKLKLLRSNIQEQIDKKSEKSNYSD